MNIRVQTIGLIAFAFLFLGALVTTAEAREAAISEINGDVMVRQGQGAWEPAQIGTVLHMNDEIKTADNGSATILLDQGAVGDVEVAPGSLFKLDVMDMDQATGEKYTLLNLAIGKVLVHAEKLQGDSKFEVRTPTSTTGVRGTMFEVSVEQA